MEMRGRMPSPNSLHHNGKMGGATRKKPHCSFCKNHGIMSSTRQHQCTYKIKCTCILCQLTKKAQIIMCHQQRVWRHNNQKRINNDITGQKCDNCRNHLRFVKKSNHDCEFKTCPCAYCKLTFKRREIMKHIQRARRLEITCDSVINEERKTDGKSREKAAALNKELASLCDDKEVEELMEKTSSESMQRPTSSLSVSPAQTESSMDSQVMLPTSSQSLYKGGDHQSTSSRKHKEKIKPCNFSYVYDLSSSNNFYQDSNKGRDRQATESPHSRGKYTKFEENSLYRTNPFSLISNPFASQEHSLLTKEEDVKPPIFDSSSRNSILSPSEERNRFNPIDSRRCIYPPPQRLLSDASSLPPINPMNRYPSFDWSSYFSSHPFLYSPYLENRQPERPPPIVRPEPRKITAIGNGTSSLLLHSPFLRLPPFAMHGLWDNPYHQNYPATDFLRAMQPRNQMLPSYNHVKIRGE